MNSLNTTPAATAATDVLAFGSLASQPTPAQSSGLPQPAFALALAAQLAPAINLPAATAGEGGLPAALAAGLDATMAEGLQAALASAGTAAAKQPSETDDAAPAQPLDAAAQATLAALLLWPTVLAPVSAAPDVAPTSGELLAADAAPVGVALPGLPGEQDSAAQLAAAALPELGKALAQAQTLTAVQVQEAAPAQPGGAAAFAEHRIASAIEPEAQQPASSDATRAAMADVLGSLGAAQAAERSGLTGIETGRAAGSAAADASVTLRGEPRQWQQPLLQALGDRLQLQIASRSDQARITLSPPLLGQVEIAIRQQASELQVRLSATHGEVRQQLQQISDALRMDLVQRHSGDVTVQVAAAGGTDRDAHAGASREGPAQQQQQSAQQQQQEQRRPGRALHAAQGEAQGFTADLRLVEAGA